MRNPKKQNDHVWRHVSKVRIARPTSSLENLAAFYKSVVGLRLLSSFNDHEGFDGYIFSAAAGGPEWELTEGPADRLQPASSRNGWRLGWVGETETLQDPDGLPTFKYPPSLVSEDVVVFRPSRLVHECARFYGDLLGWPINLSHSPDGNLELWVELPHGQGRLQIFYSALDNPPPTVEDLLVVYFNEDGPRRDIARLLDDAGVPSALPHNPWWRKRSICFADPDGFPLALAF
jgi:predicted enzyme related to lactoylglutathione lyase